MKRIILENVSKSFVKEVERNTTFLERMRSFFLQQKKTRQWALKDVTVQVGAGEVLGIIGRNGSGKSTLLKLIAKILEPTNGMVRTKGKIMLITTITKGFNDQLSVKDNLFTVAALTGYSAKDIKRKFNSIISFAELQDHVNAKWYQLSDGMRSKLTFSVALHANPDIILLDEIMGTGDRFFSKKADAWMHKLWAEKGASLVFVTHQVNVLKKNSTRALLLERGKIKMDGPTSRIVKEYVKNG